MGRTAKMRGQAQMSGATVRGAITGLA